MVMKLYGFFRSGTSHRLRIALNLKGLQYEQVAVDLRKEEHLARATRPSIHSSSSPRSMSRGG